MQSPVVSGEHTFGIAAVCAGVLSRHLKIAAHVQAPARRKDLKVSKEAAPSKPVAEVPVSPVPPKAKNGGPDEFALVRAQL